jgi:uncharacterized protein HemY
MNPKGYFLAVFSIVALALAASYIIYPSYKEESLMYFYDRRYEDAYERFSYLYDEGDRSASVAIPLVWLDLHFAQGNHAAKVLEEYVDEHPKDVSAKEYLSEVLMDLSRPHQYLLVNRDIYGIKPPKEGLSYEEKLYLHLGDFRGQKGILRQMVKDGTASQEQYVELAYLFASEGKMDRSVKVLSKLVNDKPLSSIGQNTMVFVIRVLLDFGDKEQAQVLAKEYLKEFAKFKTTLALIELFDSRGDDQFVIELIDQLPKTLQNHPVIVMNRAKQLMDLGRSDLAYQFAKKQFGNKPAKEVQKDYFLLALEEEESDEILVSLVDQLQLSIFEKEDLYRVVKQLIIQDKQEVAQAVVKNIPLDVLHATPTLNFAFELAQNPACDQEGDCIINFQDQYDLSDVDRAFLASIYQLKGYEGLAQEELLGVDSLENIPGDELFEVARLYIDLDLSDEGLGLIEELRETHPSKESEVDEAWILLASEEGQIEEVMDFLENDDTVDDTALEELFYLAVDKEYHKLAYDLAIELNEEESSPQRKELLALAMILNDKIDEGMRLFAELNKGQFGETDNYFYALTLAAKKEKKYRALLKEKIGEKLQKGLLSERDKRDYAYILLENEFMGDAASLFFELAQDKKIGTDDVQSLLYTWGKKLSDDQMNWVVDSAEKAEGKEKGFWLEQLVYVGNLQSVIDLTTSSELGVDEIADAYIAAATTMNNKRIITSAVTSIYPKENRLPRLRALGNIARDTGLSEIAREIYLRILDQDPDDVTTLEAMGGLYFDEGAYCLAKGYFKRFLECTGKDNYKVNYYLGEILWEENKRQLAKRFYDRALYLICSGEPETDNVPTEENDELSDEEAIIAIAEKKKDREEKERDKKTTEAHIFHRFDKPYLAVSIFRDLLKKYPQSLNLRIEYANVMMDLAKYRSAMHLLCCPDFCRSTLKDKSLNVDFYLAMARLMRETNHVACSIDTLQKTYCHGGDNARVDVSLADSYYVGGHWHQAMHFMNQAIDKKPLDEAYRKARKEIVWEHLPSVNFNYEYRKTGLFQREHFYRYHAFTHLTPFLAVEGKAEVDRIELQDFTSVTDGLTTPFKGVRKKGKLSVYSSNWCGDVRKGTLYYAEGVLGAGVEWKKYSYKDIYTFGFDWQRPDWEDIQSTIERGTRDQIYVEQYHRFNRFWEVNVGLAGNRYNLWHFSSAAVTWEIEGLLTFRIPQQPCLHRFLGEEAELTLNYQLDKEQIDRLKKKMSEDGEEFAPLPLTNRETHTFSIFLSKVLHDCLAIESYFGYLYDRVTGGRMHPVGGVGVLLWKRQQTQARFDYNHSASTENTTDTVDSFLFNVRHIF